MLERNKKKTQEFVVNNDFEIEESNSAKRLRATGEVSSNSYESKFNGKKVSKIENFFYHHKWHLGISVVLIAAVIFIVYSFITRVTPDVNIIYTGPADASAGRYQYIEEVLNSAIHDYNNDGKIKINFTNYQFFTQEQIDDRKKVGIQIDTLQNAENYTQFMQIIGNGDYMFCMLDHEVFNYLNSIEAFIPLTDIFEDVPHCAFGPNGILLGETEFYKSNPKIQFIPKDTVLAVRVTSSLNIKSEEKKEELQKQHIKLLQDIVNYKAPQKASN